MIIIVVSVVVVMVVGCHAKVRGKKGRMGFEIHFLGRRLWQRQNKGRGQQKHGITSRPRESLRRGQRGRGPKVWNIRTSGSELVHTTEYI